MMKIILILGRHLAGLAIAVICGLAVGPGLPARGAPAAEGDVWQSLTAIERAFLAREMLIARKEVVVLVAARPGRSAALAKDLERFDARAEALHPDVDFLVVDVPPARVPDLYRHPDVLKADILIVGGGVIFNHDDPRPTPARPDAIGPKPGPALESLAADPGALTGDHATEAEQFKAAHPGFDGRGVVIGGLEDINPAAPVLSAPATTGQPKILAYRLLTPANVSTPPIPPPKRRTDADWQQTQLVCVGGDGTLFFDGRNYRPPAELGRGGLRMALIRSTFSGPNADLAVLWDLAAGRIWISPAGSGEWSRGLELKLPAEPYGAAMASLSALGLPAEQGIRLTADAERKVIGYDLGFGRHAVMCAGIAAGTADPQTGIGGVAPGARFIASSAMMYSLTADESARSAGSDRLKLAPLFDLFSDPEVDLITYSGGVEFSAARFRLSDRGSVGEEVLLRLITRSPKAIFMSSGNGSPTARVGGPGTSVPFGIRIGGYTPPETWTAVFGLTPTVPHTMAPYSVGGPTLDGRLAPDLVAITGGICRSPRGADSFWNDPFLQLGAQYALSSGTSAAAPNAAGLGALLISAAKQAGVPYDLPRLRMALFSTAKFLEGVEARLQGHGLIQVEQAWTALQRLKDFTPPAFVTDAPVRSFRSAALPSSDRGQGLYETVGWHPGRRGQREILITRTTGPDRPVAYALAWHGDVATFSSPSKQLTLPLNVAVPLAVEIRATESGSHSAIVDLIDPVLNLGVHSVMCAVEVAEPLTSANHYTATIQRNAPRPGWALMFVDVPQGTTALRLQLSQRQGRRVTLRAEQPDGRRPIDPLAAVGEHTAASWDEKLAPSSRERYDQTFAEPQPGVWKIWVTHDTGWSPSGRDPYDPAPGRDPGADFTLKATAVRLEATPAPPASSGLRTLAFRNAFAAVEKVRLRPIGIGVAQTVDAVLPGGFPPRYFDLEIKPDTEDVVLSVEPAVETSADVSLLLWRTAPEDPTETKYVAMEINPGARKRVVLHRPAAGQYKVGLDAMGKLPPGGLPVRLRVEKHRLAGQVVGTLEEMRTLEAGGAVAASFPSVPKQEVPEGWEPVIRFGAFSDDCVEMVPLSILFPRAQDSASYQPESVALIPVPIATATLDIPRDPETEGSGAGPSPEKKP